MKKRIIGVCHLSPLPGSPEGRGPLERALESAVREAKGMKGVDALIVENFGDAPFVPGRVEPVTVAAMTRVALAVKEAARVPIGINMLRNDAVSALAVAGAVGAEFIRVNVWSGVYAAGEGLLSGNAHEVLRLRRAWGAEVKVFADVLVKHAVALGTEDPVEAAQEAAYRAGADGLIVTGLGTGKAPDAALVRAVREAVPDRPVYIGSGLTEENARELLAHADGAIVGSTLKKGGKAGRPADPARVRRLLKKIR